MKIRLVLLAAVTALSIVSGCAGKATSTRQPGAQVPGAAAQPQVEGASLPEGFPSDFPLYPGTRVTVGAVALDASGRMKYVVEIQTKDSVPVIRKFYSANGAHGPWKTIGDTQYGAQLERINNGTHDFDASVNYLPNDKGTLLSIGVEQPAKQ